MKPLAKFLYLLCFCLLVGFVVGSFLSWLVAT